IMTYSPGHKSASVCTRAFASSRAWTAFTKCRFPSPRNLEDAKRADACKLQMVDELPGGTVKQLSHRFSELARLPSKPSGSDCGEGLLHRANNYVRCVLYCFFVISHDRRRILHFNVTNHPTSLWIVQQLRRPFHFSYGPGFLILSRNAT